MRAQAQQILIYVLLLIAVAVIVLFGYQAISKIVESQRTAEIVLLQKELTEKIDSLSYGSMEIVTMKIPSKYTEACFGDKSAPANPAISNYPLIKDSIESGADENFFLEPRGEKFNIGAIEVKDGFFCAKAARSRITFRIEGKGNKVLVSP